MAFTSEEEMTLVTAGTVVETEVVFVFFPLAVTAIVYETVDLVVIATEWPLDMEGNREEALVLVFQALINGVE